MTHISQDQCTALIENRIAATEREILIDHILACPSCARRFQTMNALTDALRGQQKRRPLLIPILAAAAMLALLLPWSTRGPVPEVMAPQAMVAEQQVPLDLLTRVEDVNFRAAVAGWGRQTDLSDLIHLQNRH